MTSEYEMSMSEMELFEEMEKIQHKYKNRENNSVEKFNFEYDEILKEVADKITEKNIQYGDAYSKIPQILEILAPEGIPKDKYEEFPIVQRLIEKICRWFGDGGNQDLWDDIIGLGLNGRKHQKYESVDSDD